MHVFLYACVFASMYVCGVCVVSGVCIHIYIYIYVNICLPVGMHILCMYVVDAV